MVTGAFRWVPTLFSPIFANNPPPSLPASPPSLANTHQGKARVLLPPRTTSAALTQPRTPRFKRDKNGPTLCHSKHDHCLRSIPPRKRNPRVTTNCPWKHPQNHSNNPAPRINHPHENAPTDGIQRWGPSTRSQCHLANQQGIQHPPCSQVHTPHLPTNQPQMTAKMPACSATRPPLHPTRPQPPRPILTVDGRVWVHLGVNDSWWVHSGVSKRSCDVAPSLKIYI